MANKNEKKQLHPPRIRMKYRCQKSQIMMIFRTIMKILGTVISLDKHKEE